MRFSRQRSYGIEVRASGANIERDGLCCAHCPRHVWLAGSIDDIGGCCSICDKFICNACVGKGCKPLEERLDVMEKKYMRRDRLFELFEQSGGKVIK
jgi:hypothetical protein